MPAVSRRHSDNQRTSLTVIGNPWLRTEGPVPIPPKRLTALDPQGDHDRFQVEDVS